MSSSGDDVDALVGLQGSVVGDEEGSGVHGKMR